MKNRKELLQEIEETTDQMIERRASLGTLGEGLHFMTREMMIDHLMSGGEESSRAERLLAKKEKERRER